MLNLRVCRDIGATLIAAIGSGEQVSPRLSAIDQMSSSITIFESGCACAADFLCSL